MWNENDIRLIEGGWIKSRVTIFNVYKGWIKYYLNVKIKFES